MSAAAVARPAERDPAWLAPHMRGDYTRLRNELILYGPVLFNGTAMAVLLYLMNRTVGAPARPEWMKERQEDVAEAYGWHLRTIQDAFAEIRHVGEGIVEEHRYGNRLRYRPRFDKLPALVDKAKAKLAAKKEKAQECRPRRKQEASIGETRRRAAYRAPQPEPEPQPEEVLVIMGGEEIPLREACPHGNQCALLNTVCDANTDTCADRDTNHRVDNSPFVPPKSDPWERVKEALRGSIEPAAYHNWVVDSRFIEQTAAGVLRIAVPNEFSRDWLRDEYSADVAKALHGVEGVKSVVYEVQRSTATSTPEPAAPSREDVFEAEVRARCPNVVNLTRTVVSNIASLLATPDDVFLEVLESNEKRLRARGGGVHQARLLYLLAAKEARALHYNRLGFGKLLE